MPDGEWQPLAKKTGPPVFFDGKKAAGKNGPAGPHATIEKIHNNKGATADV